LHVQTALQQRNREGAKEAMVKLQVIGKIQGLDSCFAEIKKLIAQNNGCDLPRIRGQVSLMHQYFSSIQVFPGHIVEAYREPFERMQAALTRVNADIRRAGDGDVQEDERTQIFAGLKQYLEEFDIEEIAEALGR
jgi:hypothetical protein